MAKGFKADANGDILLENGLFLFARGVQEAAQRIKNELLTLKGEAIETPERGLDVYGIILNESSTKTQRKEEIKRCLSYLNDVNVLNIIEETDDRKLKYYLNISYLGEVEQITFEVQ